VNDEIYAAEWIEREAWVDVFEAAPPEVCSALGLGVWRVGEARVLSASGVDHILVNRTLGLGLGAPADERAVDDIIDRYRKESIPRYFVHLVREAATAGVPEWLEARGLSRYPRAWVKLGRGTGAVTRATTSLEVRAAKEAERARVGAIFEVGFEMPAGSGKMFSSVVGRPGWRACVACHEGTPVAAALLFIRDGIANLAGAATLPAFRGRGAQGALMARRITEALELGCRLIVSETGEAASGDPQHSYRNMTRHGLRPICLRDNYALRGMTWARA
jgi:ribosomal protein S18 acetylase RimI-like enzyme